MKLEQIIRDAEKLHNSIQKSIKIFTKKHPGRRVDLDNGHASIDITNGVTFSVRFNGKESKP